MAASSSFPKAQESASPADGTMPVEHGFSSGSETSHTRASSQVFLPYLRHSENTTRNLRDDGVAAVKGHDSQSSFPGVDRELAFVQLGLTPDLNPEDFGLGSREENPPGRKSFKGCVDSSMLMSTSHAVDSDPLVMAQSDLNSNVTQTSPMEDVVNFNPQNEHYPKDDVFRLDLTPQGPCSQGSSSHLLHADESQCLVPEMIQIGDTFDKLWFDVIPTAIAEGSLDDNVLKLIGNIESRFGATGPEPLYWRLALGRFFLKLEWVRLFDVVPDFLRFAPADVQKVYRQGKVILDTAGECRDGAVRAGETNLTPSNGAQVQVTGLRTDLSPALKFIYERVYRRVPARYEANRNHAILGPMTPICADVFALRVVLTAEELLSYFPRQTIHFRSITWRLINNGWTATNMLEFQFVVRGVTAETKKMPGFSRTAVQHSISKATKLFLEDERYKFQRGPIADLYLWNKPQDRGSHVGADQLEDMPIIHLPYGLTIRPSGKGRGLLSAAIELCEAAGNDQITLRNFDEFARQSANILWGMVDRGFWADLENGADLDEYAVRRHRAMMDEWSFEHGGVMQ